MLEWQFYRCDDRCLQCARRHLQRIGETAEGIEQVADHRHGMAGHAVELQRRSVIGFDEAGGDFELAVDGLGDAPERAAAIERVDKGAHGLPGNGRLSLIRCRMQAGRAAHRGSLKAVSVPDQAFPQRPSGLDPIVGIGSLHAHPT